MTRVLIILLLSLTHLSLLAWQQINGFVYHRFGDDRYSSTNIDIQRFEEQLQYLRDNGYRTLTLSEAINKVRKNGTQEDKMVVLTIDDAYKSFYQKALPLLKQYQIKATLFVNTETVGAGDFMSWDEIRETQTSGVEIGNHSHSHAYFLNASAEDFRDDLAQSEALFKANLARSPSVYAYPYGKWNVDMVSFLKQAGYAGAAAQHSGVMHPNSNRFALPRFPMSTAYAAIEQFIEKLQMKGFNEASSTFHSTALTNVDYPYLSLTLDHEHFDGADIQGFISGKKAIMTHQEMGNDRLNVRLWTEEALTHRRTRFTVTAKDRQGKWHWMSYVFIQPEIRER